MFAITLSRVRRGTTVFPANSSGHTIAIDPPLSSLTRSLLLVHGRQFTSDGAYTNFIGHIASDQTLSFYARSGVGAGSAHITYEILEFSEGSEITVQRGVFAGSLNRTKDIALPSTIGDTSKAFVLARPSGPDGFGLSAGDGLTANVTSDRTLHLGISTSASVGVGWQVVELGDQSSVVTGAVDLGGSTSSADVSLSKVNPDFTILVVGNRITSSNNGGTSDSVTAYLKDSSTLHIERGISGTNSREAIYQVIHSQRFKNSAVTGTLAKGTLSATTTPANLQPNFAAFLDVPQGVHRISSGDAGLLGPGLLAYTLDGSAIDIDRDDSSLTVDYAFQVLQIDGSDNPDLVDSTDVIDLAVQPSSFSDSLTERSFSYGFSPLETLCDVMSRSTKRLGDRFDLSASDVSFWTNEAYLEVANLAPHDALETIRYASFTSTTPPRLALPTDYNEPITLSRISWEGSPVLSSGGTSGSRTTLERISQRELTGLSAASGPPSKYALFDRHIEIYPGDRSSDYSLELRYKEYPSVLTGCSSQLRLSPPWRQAVLYRTTQRLAELVGDDRAAAREQNQYAGYVATLDSDLAKRQKSEEQRGVSVHFGSRGRSRRR